MILTMKRWSRRSALKFADCAAEMKTAVSFDFESVLGSDDGLKMSGDRPGPDDEM
jgi:hypothetical protein